MIPEPGGSGSRFLWLALFSTSSFCFEFPNINQRFPGLVAPGLDSGVWRPCGLGGPGQGTQPRGLYAYAKSLTIKVDQRTGNAGSESWISIATSATKHQVAECLRKPWKADWRSKPIGSTKYIKDAISEDGPCRHQIMNFNSEIIKKTIGCGVSSKTSKRKGEDPNACMHSASQRPTFFCFVCPQHPWGHLWIR